MPCSTRAVRPRLRPSGSPVPACRSPGHGIVRARVPPVAGAARQRGGEPLLRRKLQTSPAAGHGFAVTISPWGSSIGQQGSRRIDLQGQLGRDQRPAPIVSGSGRWSVSVVCRRLDVRTRRVVIEVQYGLFQAGSTAVRGPSNQLLTRLLLASVERVAADQRLDGAPRSLRSQPQHRVDISRSAPTAENQAARRGARVPAWQITSALRRQISWAFRGGRLAPTARKSLPARTRGCDRGAGRFDGHFAIRTSVHRLLSQATAQHWAGGLVAVGCREAASARPDRRIWPRRELFDHRPLDGVCFFHAAHGPCTGAS